MRRTGLTTAALFLAVLILTQAPAPGQGQQFNSYPPFETTREFSDALRLADSVSSSRREEGVQGFLELANRHRGTTLGAHALLEAAVYSADQQKSRELYQRILAEYPGSRFEILAHVAFIHLDFGYQDAERQVVLTDQIAQQFGGPCLKDIQRDRRRAVASYVAMPDELRYGLLRVYYDLHALLASQLKRYDEALPVALFGREAFADDARASGTFLNCVRHDMIVLRLGEVHEPLGVFPRVSPTVTVRPKDGHRTGPRPKIRVEITAGDFRRSQVSLGAVEVRLDGQDVRPLMTARSKLDRLLREGKPFERIRLRFRPTAALAAGTHTITVVAPTGGYHEGDPAGITRVTSTFAVAKSKDNPEDELSDEEEDRDEAED